MHRRTFTLGAASVVGLLSGCLRGSSGGTDALRLESRSLSVSDRTCKSSVEQTATVEFRPDESSVALRGTIRSKSPCDEAALTVFTSRNERSDETAIVTVRTERPEDSDCKQCPTALTYDAELAFNRTPTTVRVEHDPRNGSLKEIGVYERG